MKISTYHKRIWLVGKDIKIAEPQESVIYNKIHKINTFLCPSDYVCVVFSETLKQFQLYIGYKTPHKEAMSKVMGLALKLEVGKIIIEKVESTKDLLYWDRLVNNLNTKLFASPDLFS